MFVCFFATKLEIDRVDAPQALAASASPAGGMCEMAPPSGPLAPWRRQPRRMGEDECFSGSPIREQGYITGGEAGRPDILLGRAGVEGEMRSAFRVGRGR